MRKEYQYATCFLLAAFLAVVVLAAGSISVPAYSEDVQEFEFHFAGVNEKERLVADQVRSLANKFDLAPWILTRKIRVESGVIPHSHPMLTLHTKYLGNPDGLLATFLHEQIHWHLASPVRQVPVREAKEELRRLYPKVPKAVDGGAASRESTYLHLLVNWLEFDALVSLVGRENARRIIEEKDHYEWIYARILADDARLESLMMRHGLLIDR